MLALALLIHVRISLAHVYFLSIDCGTVRLSQFVELWKSVGILQDWCKYTSEDYWFTLGMWQKHVCYVSVRLIWHVRLNNEDPKSQSNAVDFPRIPTGHHCCRKTFTSEPFVLTLGVAVKKNMGQWWNDTKRGKPKYGEKDWDRFFLFTFLSIYGQTNSGFAKHVFCYTVRITQLLAICRLYAMHKQNNRNAFTL